MPQTINVAGGNRDTGMELPIKPRYLIGALGMIIVGALMFTETVGADVGLTVIVGILATLGAYMKRAPEHK